MTTMRQQLEAGLKVANKWYHRNKSTILAKQIIKKYKKAHYAGKQLVSK